MSDKINCILIVEDSKVVAKRLNSALLAALPHIEVTIALTGEAALQAVKSEHPCLVILDLQLPGISGIEVLRKIKKQQSDTIVLVFTNNADDYNRSLCTGAGAYRFYDKTNEFEKILKDLVALNTRDN